MRSPTAQEAFAYAEQIEHESRAFYLAAAERVQDPEAHALLLELGADEALHAERVRGLALRLGASESTELPGLELPAQGQVVGTPALPEGAGRTEILRTALGREENTLRLYTTLLSLTDLPLDVESALEDLRHQEQGHATRLRRLLG